MGTPDMPVIAFANSWLLLLAPLPVLAWMLLPAARERGAVRVPDSVIAHLKAHSRRTGTARQTLPEGILPKSLGWLALIVAMAGPYIPQPAVLTPTGRDIVVALDLSASMAQTDMIQGETTVARIDVIREQLTGFLQSRRGDRAALIGFATEAFLIAPLSFDTGAVAEMLDEVTIGLPGRKTDLGQAIGLTVKLLRAEGPGERILILISDGEANAGDLAAKDAAAMADAIDVKIYAIGFAGEVDPRNQAHMTELAEMTGGRFLAATDPAAIAHAYAAIDALAPVTPDASSADRRRDLRWLALVVALGCVTLLGWREYRDP